MINSFQRSAVFAGFSLALILWTPPAIGQVVPQPVALQLIRDKSVHQELNLDADQVRTIESALQNIDPPWFRSRNLAVTEQSVVISDLTTELEQVLKPSFSAKQNERFSQMQCQALGTRMFLRDDVIAKLDIDQDQVRRLTDLYVKTDAGNAALQQRLRDGDLTTPEANRKQSKLQTGERTGVVAILRDDQRSKLGLMTGEPFALSAVTRMYPMAPEISPEGAKWVQGGPIALSDLKGKVVAVHFYAYQCINCIRNLPHYTAWHNDYADEGLVVIGIQTPETPSERRFEDVAAAVAREGITYPVVLDADSTSWKAYSNTMWPTVYLIDKEGYLRRWWQGELNWKGGDGEQQLRGTIETLLAE